LTSSVVEGVDRHLTPHTDRSEVGDHGKARGSSPKWQR